MSSHVHRAFLYSLLVLPSLLGTKEDIKKTIVTFYNRYDIYQNVLDRQLNDIGISIMEPTERTTLLYELLDHSSAFVQQAKEQNDSLIVTGAYLFGCLSTGWLAINLSGKALHAYTPVNVNGTLISLSGACYFGYKVMQSIARREELEEAQFHEDYMRFLIRSYEK